MNMMIAAQSGQTMTSREMAELTEKRHDSVKRTIDTLAEKGLIGEPHRVEYLDALNRPAIEYGVGKRDSYVIVAQLSPEFTARLVDRWQALEARTMAGLPDFTNPAEAARAWATQFEERRSLESKIVADAPKVAFAEAVRALDGVCHIEKVAKTLGYGRTRFFKRLREDGILMGNNLPYQKYLDREYFTVAEREPYTDKDGRTHPTFTTMVTGAGQVFLARRYGTREGDCK